MMRVYAIEISDEAYKALVQLAHRQHRDFRQQAAVLVEQAVLADIPPYQERTPRLTEFSNGTGVREGQGAEA